MSNLSGRLKFRYSEKATNFGLTLLCNFKKQIRDFFELCGLLTISDLYVTFCGFLWKPELYRKNACLEWQIILEMWIFLSKKSRIAISYLKLNCKFFLWKVKKFSYLLCSAFTLYCTWFYYIPSFGKLETDLFERGGGV